MPIISFPKCLFERHLRDLKKKKNPRCLWTLNSSDPTGSICYQQTETMVGLFSMLGHWITNSKFPLSLPAICTLLSILQHSASGLCNWNVFRWCSGVQFVYRLSGFLRLEVAHIFEHTHMHTHIHAHRAKAKISVSV